MKYNMKKVVMVFAFAGIGLGAVAQDANVKNGIKMYHYKKFKSAQAALAPLADKDPLANYYLGLTYLEQGNLQQAQATFMKFPEDAANISGTARVAFLNKDVTNGNRIAKELAGKAKRKEWEPLKYAADAIAYTEGGDYAMAQAWYKEALTKAGPADKPELHIGLGDVMRKVTGGGGEAMNNYEAVVEKDKTNSLAYSRIGDLWYDARTYQSALENYGHAKDADSLNPLPYKSLAYAYARSGKYSVALQNMQRYIPLSDNTFEDQLEYTRVLYQAQSYCDAATNAKKLLQNKPNPANVTELTGILGFSQTNCGDSMAALTNLRKYFTTQDPTKITGGAYMEYSKLYLKLDMLDSAGAYAIKAFEKDTSVNVSEALRPVADAYKAKKDWCQSAAWYDKIVKANPNAIANDYVWRVIMYYYCNDWVNAMPAANDFETKYGAEQPSAYYWQARVAAAIDSEATTGAAVPYFQKWLEKIDMKTAKQSDVKMAYEYMLYYAFNSKNKEEIKVLKEKIIAIDPNSNAVKQVEELEKQGGSPPRQPAKK